MLKIWKLTDISVEEMDLANATSLDAVTRQLPDGYYSTFRTFDGCTRVLGFDAHLRRLYDPVQTPDVNAPSLRRQLLALLEPYRPDETRVRLIMTEQGQTYVAIEPLKRLPREVYEKGVRVETTDMYRATPRLKSTAFIGVSDSERKHIAREGIFEALLVKDGNIVEGMTSNFFYIISRASSALPGFDMAEERHLLNQRSSAQRDVILCTASDDILLGITREHVLAVAQAQGLEVRYQPLKRDQLAAASEAFITSSSRGIVPVVQIDAVMIGQGSPGFVTKQLSTAYEAYVLDHAEKILPE